MAKKQQNTSDTSAMNSNLFNKGMMKDVTDIFIGEGLWTHAVNAINNSHYGETGSIGNEPSNLFCTSAPYTIIGYAHKPDTTEWVVFSTNDVDSEIGVFDQTTCTYKKIVNDQCLNFKKTHIITAVAKKNTDCTYGVYWQDNLNPDRTLNLDNVPYICEPASEDPCDGEICTDQLDCEKLRLQPALNEPCIRVKKSKGGGQLNNGSYMAVIAYSENGIKLTDYSMPSVPLAVWRNENQGNSIEVEIENLDLEFDEYELVIVAVVTQQAIAKKIGYYNTRQNRVVIDLIQGALETVPLNNITLRSNYYERSEKMIDLNGYLVRMGLSTLPLFNYQPLANQIVTKWVAVQYDVDYYWNGGTATGYYRDEVYAFFIRWVYKTGTRSASYHIPGRAANPTDIAPVTGPDVLFPNETQRWQVYDTSTIQPASGDEVDGGVIISKGDMGYWESSERYPADPQVWGSLCFQPIRHHKMPSNETIHIHNQGGGKINVLGVEFQNIQHPVDNDGNPIPDIIGYEILRGSREGNRSIVAKGIFANMLEFDIKGITASQNTKGLMQNYPWNDLRPDPFLSDDYTILDNNVNEDDWEDASRLSIYRRNYLSFHSVETNFIRPSFGGNYIKLYTTQFGRAYGKFEIPFKHPKFKLLSEGAIGLAFAVGLGIAIINAIGKTTQTGGNSTGAFATGGGTHALASRDGAPATIITDLLSGALLSTFSSGGQTNLIGVIAGIVGFATQLLFWIPQGMDVVLQVIYSLSNFRDYYLQYNGYGFYSQFVALNNNAVPAGVRPSVRRLVAPDGAKYIGSGLQDFDANYRINNLFRTSFVCVKTTANVPDPSVLDNSKARVADVNGINGITYKNPTGGDFIRQISSHYGAIKVDFENQYGQLESVVQIPTGSCIYGTLPLVGPTYSTNTIFGGDVYINRYTEKNPYFFFNSWLIDSIDGTEFDYTQYVNGPAPRYYAIFNKYDMSDFDIQFSWNFPTDALPDVDLTTPSDFYRFDEENTAVNNARFIRKFCYAYLFYNGVRDYFTESELNMAYRDYAENEWEKFYDPYGNSFNDIQTMFRSDIITKPTFYKYDLSLSTSRLYYNISKWGSVLPRDYDPELYETCFQYFPNRVVYSLQNKLGLKRDNWRNYLLLNFKDFNAKPNIIKTLNAQGAVVLFEDAEPIQFIGVDQLQTTGATKITIGDGGLFQQNYQGLTNADDALSYGSCISSRSAVNTPFGLFWISQKLGKIMQFGGSLEEISRNGMKYWFAKNLPSKLLEMYPDYPYYDNPIAGIGCQAIYDPTYELLYFTKKDYVPLRDDLFFDDPSGVPYYVCGQITPGPNDVVVPEPTVNPEECEDCPEGFELINGVCVKETITPAVYSGPLITIDKGRRNGQAYNKFGLRLYPDISAQVKPVKGVGTYSAYEVRATNGGGNVISPVTNVQSTLWGADGFCGGSNSGRLNNAGVWPNDGNSSDQVDNPVLEEICYEYCLDVPETRQYLIGIAGDNEVKIYVDNQLWVYLSARDSGNNPDSSNGRPFYHWHLFPVTLPAGVRTIKLCGFNFGQQASFAAEIYDLTLNQIQTNGLLTPRDTVTSSCGSISADIEPFIIFSTRDFIGESIPDPSGTGSYTCPDGGVINSECSLPNCIKIETLPAGSCVACTLFASATNIDYGQSLTLFWTSTNAVSVEMNNGVGTVSLNGSITVNPSDNTTYYIVATDSEGLTSVCAIDIRVNPVITKCPCNYDDPTCFQPCDWTISYDPKVKQWISFHDWKPSFMIPSYKNFYSTKDNGIWKHNDRWDSYCNYYGQDYFWEVEYPIVTPNNVTVLKSVEYTLDVYKFYNEGRDAFHVLDENFDRAIVYNSEQISGLLRLTIKGKNAPLDVIQTPTFNGTSIDIFFSKEENKYRFNQFWDITNDRGEFTGTQLPMWNTKCSGYEREINAAYVDYTKPLLEHKKFRHYGNKIILRKNRSNDKKMVLKITNTKNTFSPR